MGLPGVYFTNENTGIAVGDNGSILRTTNWRTIWTEQNAAM